MWKPGIQLQQQAGDTWEPGATVTPEHIEFTVCFLTPYALLLGNVRACIDLQCKVSTAKCKVSTAGTLPYLKPNRGETASGKMGSRPLHSLPPCLLMFPAPASSHLLLEFLGEPFHGLVWVFPLLAAAYQLSHPMPGLQVSLAERLGRRGPAALHPCFHMLGLVTPSIAAVSSCFAFGICALYKQPGRWQTCRQAAGHSPTACMALLCLFSSAAGRSPGLSPVVCQRLGASWDTT